MKAMLRKSVWILAGLLLPASGALFWPASVQAQPNVGPLTADNVNNLLTNGGFEAGKPAYWDASGSGATWSTEQARTPGYSLKLSGAGEASWQQAEAIRNWVGSIAGNLEIVVGGYVRTEGVNTAPAGDADKFQLVFEFFDANGADLLGEPLVIDVPQDQANSDGWVAIDNTALGSLTLPANAPSVRITFRKGANATGTVYLDDVFIHNADPANQTWPGGWFNPNMDAGDTWYYWWDGFDAGKEDWPENQPFFQTVTDEEAHSGQSSLKLVQNVPTASEAVAISQRVPVTPGEPVLVSFWVKTEGVLHPDSIGTADYNIGMTALFYNNMEAGAAGYGEIGGADIRLNGEYNPMVIPLVPRQEETGWTQYAFVVNPKEGAVGMELRLRYWHHFEGTTYWDDVFIAPVNTVTETLPNLLSNGDFEAEKPAYWDATGAGATWSTEQARTPGYSLKLSGAGEANWQMGEAVRNWTGAIAGNLEIIVGGWVRTEGVNTAPASDADKFQLVFEFFDAGGADLLGEPLVIDVPQTDATSDGWIKIDNTSLGSLTLPANAPSARITFRKGANATGTVYLDDVFITKADPNADGWAGDWFNPNMDAGDTWYYWWDNFSAGTDTWPDTQPFFQTVTDEEVHSGARSLKVVQNDPNASETVAISDRVPVMPGEPVLVSFWVKTEGVLHPDSIGTADYNIGLTALWYNNLESGAAGYGEIGGADVRLNGDYNPMIIPLVPREEETGWTKYAFVFYPKEGAVGMELRLRYWHHFEGTVYWDDVAINNVGGSALTTAIEDDPNGSELPHATVLHQNYPNPFNPSTTIAFDLPNRTNVTLEVYNMLGQRVAVLVNDNLLSAGRHQVEFNASEYSSGVYMYVLKTDKKSEARTMVLMK